LPSSPQPGATLPYSEFSQRVEEMNFASIGPEHGSQFPEFTLHRPPSPAPRFDFFDAPSMPKLAVPETHGPLFPDAYAPDPESLDALKDLRPLGQIHDSFIIAAGRDGLWIIDQHVAHERILFEQVLAARMNGGVETQRLLIPLVIGLSAAQQIEYARIADELNAVGFDTEPFGNRTIAVKAAPAGVGAADVERVLFEILEIAESELRKASLDELRAAMAASIACRAAIKINMKLEPAKIDWLLRALAATSCPMSCPHGRPIALRYSTRDILKSFHRI
jgi:DNA mismatch repair protein MutL